MSKINLIYTTDVAWEVDWIKDVICKDVELDVHLDTDFQTVLPRAVIVMNCTNGTLIDTYITKFINKGYKFGVIHLSDEAYQHPIQHYRKAEFVLRNYYSKAYENLGNVEFFPLGYKKGFTVNPSYKLSDARQYKWSFVGQVEGKPTREAMCNAMSEIDDGYLYITRCWDDPKGLSVEDYQATLEDSVYTACPSGWINPDSFRLCEALEAGSIPIVEKGEYFKQLFGGDVPFVVAGKWENITEEFLSTIDENKLQAICFKWWTEQKEKFNKKFKRLVAKLENPVKKSLEKGNKKYKGALDELAQDQENK